MKKESVSIQKQNKIKELVKEMEKYQIIGVIDLINVPSLQLQRMRYSLKHSVKIIMCKGRLIKIALKELKRKNIEELCKYVKGMPALVLTNEDPFTLARILKKSRSAAPAKAGQIAPNNIVVAAGQTSFSPGPIIGELGSIGVKTGIEAGKVVIKQDSIVVKEGQMIQSNVATLLTRLGIEPMEIGLNITGVYENGEIYTRKVLDIDEKQFASDLIKCAKDAFNLAFNISYPTKENIDLLIKKAHLDALIVTESNEILTTERLKNKILQSTIEINNIVSKMPEENFRKEEEIAQNILKELQEKKIKVNKT